MLGVLFSLNPDICTPPLSQTGFAWAQPHYLQARNGLCQQHAVCPMCSLRRGEAAGCRSSLPLALWSRTSRKELPRFIKPDCFCSLTGGTISTTHTQRQTHTPLLVLLFLHMWHLLDKKSSRVLSKNSTRYWRMMVPLLYLRGGTSPWHAGPLPSGPSRNFQCDNAWGELSAGLISVRGASQRPVISAPIHHFLQQTERLREQRGRAAKTPSHHSNCLSGLGNLLHEDGVVMWS